MIFVIFSCCCFIRGRFFFGRKHPFQRFAACIGLDGVTCCVRRHSLALSAPPENVDQHHENQVRRRRHDQKALRQAVDHHVLDDHDGRFFNGDDHHRVPELVAKACEIA